MQNTQEKLLEILSEVIYDDNNPTVRVFMCTNKRWYIMSFFYFSADLLFISFSALLDHPVNIVNKQEKKINQASSAIFTNYKPNSVFIITPPMCNTEPSFLFI